MAAEEPTLHRVVMTLCSACLDGLGVQCHTPGCALIRNRPPYFSIRDSCDVESIDGVPFDHETLKRAVFTPSAARAAGGLVERVARAISEYPDSWDWWKANSGQREHWERLAKKAIAIVCTVAIPDAEARGRDAERQDVLALWYATDGSVVDEFGARIRRGEHVAAPGGQSGGQVSATGDGNPTEQA